MKATKLIYLSLSAIALSLAACSKDEAGETKPSIEVVKSNFSYTYEAGTGQIEVNADGFTVETDAPWLTATANGRTIALSLEKNEGAESRTANVIIKKGNDVQRVPITQMGVVNVMSLSNLEFQRRGGEHRFPIDKMDSQPELTPSDSWFSAELVGQELVVSVQPFPVGHTADRTATLRVRAGLFDRTITINQKYGVPEYADLLGTYTLRYKPFGLGAEQTASVTLVEKERGVSFTLQGLVSEITLQWNATTSALTLPLQSVDGGQADLKFSNGVNSFDNNQGVTMVAPWNQDRTNPGYIFSTTATYSYQGNTEAVKGFLLWANGGGWYRSGQGINAIFDFTLTKQ